MEGLHKPPRRFRSEQPDSRRLRLACDSMRVGPDFYDQKFTNPYTGNTYEIGFNYGH